MQADQSSLVAQVFIGCLALVQLYENRTCVCVCKIIRQLTGHALIKLRLIDLGNRRTETVSMVDRKKNLQREPKNNIAALDSQRVVQNGLSFIRKRVVA